MLPEICCMGDSPVVDANRRSEEVLLALPACRRHGSAFLSTWALVGTDTITPGIKAFAPVAGFKRASGVRINAEATGRACGVDISSFDVEI
jgi:hypothetical protein